jgi:hypothetical protein
MLTALVASLLLPMWLAPVAEGEMAPAVAGNDGSVWYIEKVMVLLGLFVLLITVFVYGVLRGQVPTSISKDGLTFPPAAATAMDALADRLDQVENRLTLAEADVRLALDHLTGP